MFRIYTINKSNRQRVDVIASGLTEREAESFCEAWGWSYSDEAGNSFYVDYEEEEYTLHDFTIVSTECDMLLFFSSSYQDAVNKAINKIMSSIEVNIQNKKLLLVCYKSCIEIKDNNKDPEIYNFELLDEYDSTLDKESFELGTIAV